MRQRSRALVIILLSGRPMLVTEPLEQAQAFVAAWLPGSEAQGVAEALFGDQPFTGRLPFAWPRSADQLPLAGDDPQALFPRGYGLTTPGAYQLVWSDEFDGSALDPANWAFDLGGGGWGNGELQYYTDRPVNVRLEDGHLVIEAIQEKYKGHLYTSTRIKTQRLQAWTYGRIEARLRLPSGQGIWPAFWMLGANINNRGWPYCGEIDIMEFVGKEPYNVHGTLHGPQYAGGDSVTRSKRLPYPASAAFHVFAVEWEPEQIRWYLDGELWSTLAPGDVPGDWVYDHDFFIILNLAVGGLWPGSPDKTSVFPQQLLVDYVRVYQVAPAQEGP
jgi:beta-glucanase (GH16 family)